MVFQECRSPSKFQRYVKSLYFHFGVGGTEVVENDAKKSKIENSKAETTEVLKFSGSRFQGIRNHLRQVFGLLSQFHGQVFEDFD